MAQNTQEYSNGVIEQTCPTCGAVPFQRCKNSSGYGTVRSISPHKKRIIAAEEAREREQG